MQSAQRIERREYKYLVPERRISALRQAITPFCTLDTHAAREPTLQYPIHSLYFDTPSLSFFWANQRTQVDRFKLRLRHYPGDELGPIFFEVKRRCNDVIEKSRVATPPQIWRELLDDPAGSALQAFEGAQRSALERFLFLCGTHGAQPVTLVRYQREAWVSQVDDYARVTFDRQICSVPQRQLSLRSGRRAWRNLDYAAMQGTSSSMVVVELKFSSNAPRWMTLLVQRFDLLRQSFSKYGSSIKTWQLNEPLSRATRGSGGVFR